jgi:hypothetical protein
LVCFPNSALLSLMPVDSGPMSTIITARCAAFTMA